MAEPTKSASRQIVLDTTSAQFALDKLGAKMDAIDKKIADANAKGQAVPKLEEQRTKLLEKQASIQEQISKGLGSTYNQQIKYISALRSQLNNVAVGTGEWKKKLDQLKSAEAVLEGMRNKVKEVSTVQTEAVNKTSALTRTSLISANVIGNFFTMALEKGKQYLFQAVDMAVKAEGVRNAFKNLNRPDLLDNLRAATRGTVSDLELMKRAVQANNFQIPLETLGTLLQFAQRRARETGESVDYLVESIVTGIARKSPLILDNLGINIQRIQKEFEKTGDFAKAAMNVVNQEMQNAGPQIDLVADKVDRFNARFKNILTQLGDASIKIGEFFIDAYQMAFNKTQYAFDDARRKQSEQAEKTQERAYNVFNSYLTKYAAADKTGQTILVAQLKDRLEKQKELEANYRQQGITDQANYYKILIKQGNDFLNSIGQGNKPKNTLSALQEEKTLLESQLQGLEIGSKNFAATKKRIDEIQEKINRAMGNLPKEDKKIEQLRDKFNATIADLNRIALEANMTPLEKSFNAVNIKLDQMRSLVQELRKAGLNTLADQINNMIPNIGTILTNDAIQQSDKPFKKAETETGKKDIKSILTKITSLLTGRDEGNIGDPVLGTKELEEQQLQKFASQVNQYLELSRSAVDVFAQFTAAVNNKDEQRFRAEMRRLDEKRRTIESMAKSEVITKQQATIELNNLERQREKKQLDLERRQFERNKRIQITQALINGATGITSVLAARPGATDIISLGLFRAINIGITAATTAAQIAFISSQKPSFAKGGIVGGNSRHGSRYGESGIALIDRKTGQEQGEMESGEPYMILSRKFREKNAGLIPRLLEASRNGTVVPMYAARPLSTIDYGAVRQSISQRQFATGGIFNGGSTPANQENPLLPLIEQLNQNIAINTQSNLQLVNRLNQPIESYMRLQQVYDAEDTLNKILQEVA